MTGRDPALPPVLGRRRRRPLFRRLFYREDPFAVLEPRELRATFEAFACVARLYPVILYWVHRLGDDEFLVSSFRHPSMLRYSGREVVHVTPDDVGYYRLPGAKIGGRGHVAPGVYSIAIQAPDKERHYLRIRKDRHGQLHLDEVCERADEAASFLVLDRHVLDRSKFAVEMRTVVERGIEWDYQRALLGEPDQLSVADRAELIQKCAGISPRIDAFLDRLAGCGESRGGQA